MGFNTRVTRVGCRRWIWSYPVWGITGLVRVKAVACGAAKILGNNRVKMELGRTSLWALGNTIDGRFHREWICGSANDIADPTKLDTKGPSR